jgi:hypothetical protein
MEPIMCMEGDPSCSPSHQCARLLVVLAALMASLAEFCFAAADAPTLLRWSYGEGGEGGPRLDEPLVTDRPDFTESSVTVGRGVVQFESGYTYLFDDDASNSVREHTFPELLMRVGVLADWFELRVGYTLIEGTTHEFGAGRATFSGSNDLYLGMKFALTGQEGILPEMAIVPQMFVPSGSSDHTAGETLPGANWLYGWDVTEFIAMGAQTQVNRRLDDVTGEPYAEFSQSWTINYSLADRLGGYTEWFCLAPDGADTNHNENYFDGGLTFLATDNLQLDIRAGVGLNAAAADLFTGAGLSIRL